MKRRGKMLSRAVFWTLGALLGFFTRKWLGGHPNPETFVSFWSGMMLASVFVHFDPPEIDRWEQSA
jgi:hypothetical protein